VGAAGPPKPSLGEAPPQGGRFAPSACERGGCGWDRHGRAGPPDPVPRHRVHGEGAFGRIIPRGRIGIVVLTRARRRSVHRRSPDAADARSAWEPSPRTAGRSAVTRGRSSERLEAPWFDVASPDLRMRRHRLCARASGNGQPSSLIRGPAADEPVGAHHAPPGLPSPGIGPGRARPGGRWTPSAAAGAPGWGHGRDDRPGCRGGRR
jgi:hypothetical protein